MPDRLKIDPKGGPEMKPYYSNWQAEKFSCKCGWSGLGSELKNGEIFESLYEVDCPSCVQPVDIITYPTLAESRANWDKVEAVDKAIVEMVEYRIQAAADGVPVQD
jgi:hypothetical protein